MVRVSAAYANDLSTLDQGYALWTPEPQEAGEVHIGDVGFVDRDGAFMRLLNVREKDPRYGEYKVTWWPHQATGVEPLEEAKIRIKKILNPLAPGQYHSRGVEATSVEASASGSVAYLMAVEGAAERFVFIRQTPGGPGVSLSATYKCHEEHGAILDLSSPTISERLIESGYLAKYVLRNHASWVSFAKRPNEEGGLDLKGFSQESDIVFIQGFTKTAPTWEAIRFGSSHSERSGGADVDAGALAAAKLVFAKKRSNMPPVAARRGAAHVQPLALLNADRTQQQDSPGTEETLPVDQTIFVQRYMVKKNFFGVLRIRGGAGYYQPPDRWDDMSSAAGDGVEAGGSRTGENESDAGESDEGESDEGGDEENEAKLQQAVRSITARTSVYYLT